MNKILLFFLLSLVGVPGWSAASKPEVKKIEIEDPLLEDDLFQESLSEEDEKKNKIESGDILKGNTPLEENPIVEPPKTESKVTEPEINESDLDAEFEALDSQPKVEPKIAPKALEQPQKVTSETKQEKGPKSKKENSFLEPMAPPARDTRVSKALEKNESLPRWNAHDPRKGFLEETEEGAYFYKEESSESSEKQYNEESGAKPKARNYQKGLESVSSDGSYLYTIEESELEGSASIRIASLPPLPIQNKLGITYEDVYGTDPMMVILIDYDWLAFKKFGHWVLSVGTGVGTRDGPGRFIDNLSVAKEIYSLYVLLNHVSLVYRFQYTKKPWFVPYVSVGAVPTVLFERRDDDKRNKIAFSPSIQASGGVRFNIGRLDNYGSGQLDAEYGINNMWMDVEFRRVQSFSEDLDISSNLINAGLGFDF